MEFRSKDYKKLFRIQFDDEFSQIEHIMTLTLVESINKRSMAFRETMEKIFFDEIYLEREAHEYELKNKLIHSEKATAITGEGGCGKTTLLRKAIRDIDTKKFPYIYIDMNIHKGTGNLKKIKTYDDWSLSLSAIISEEIKRKFYPSFSDIDNIHQFVLFTDEEGTFQRDKHIRRLKELYIDENGEPPLNINSLQIWFNNSKLPKLHKYKIRLEALYEYRHLINALKYNNHNIDKFLVILDNVDILNSRMQTFCFEFSLEFYHCVVANGKIITAIRSENLRHPPCSRAYYHCDPDSIELKLTDTKSDIKLPPEVFNQILKKRLDYYRDNKKEVGEKVSTLFKKIYTLNKLLKDTYAQIYLLDLANQSIRIALTSHMEFVRHIMEKYYDGTFDLLDELLLRNPDKDKVKSLLKSLLYGWIAKYTEDLNTNCLNVVKVYDDIASKNFMGNGCDLSYLILVNVYNSTKNNTGPIRVGMIVDNLVKLGFDKNEIKEMIYKLYKLKDVKFGYMLTIWSERDINQWNSIDDNDEIEINFRGQTLLNRVLISFSYTNRLLFHTNHYENRDMLPTSRYYDFDNYAIHSENSVKFISKLADVHLLELQKICIRRGGKQWLEWYKKLFCLKINNVRQLQIEHLIDDNVAFLNNIINYFPGEADKNNIKRHKAILNKIKELYSNTILNYSPGQRKIPKISLITNDLLRTIDDKWDSNLKNPKYDWDITDKISHMV